MDKKVLRNFALIGLGIGAVIAVLNLILGILIGRYIILDIIGAAYISYSAASNVYSWFVEQGKRPNFRSFIVPVLAAALPFLLIQMPVMALALKDWPRLFLLDLAVIGLMVVAAWMYASVEDWERFWLRFVVRGTRSEEKIRYSHIYAVVGVIDVLFFGVILVGSNTAWKNETVSWLTNLGFGAFVLLGVILIVAYLFERHYVSEEGIWYRPPLGLGPRRFMAWDEVKSVDYSPWAQWVVLKSYSGRTARIPVLATNTGRFACLLLAHVPEDRISKEAMQTLKMLTDERIDER